MVRHVAGFGVVAHVNARGEVNPFAIICWPLQIAVGGVGWRSCGRCADNARLSNGNVAGNSTKADGQCGKKSFQGDSDLCMDVRMIQLRSSDWARCGRQGLLGVLAWCPPKF